TQLKSSAFLCLLLSLALTWPSAKLRLRSANAIEKLRFPLLIALACTNFAPDFAAAGAEKPLAAYDPSTT
ncbi:MAG: hypothetical protein LUC86_07135, partial [Prevotellaceae bacterium]|nr:hypothetical protein [Prevotellaceae bacterium]MCD8304582.1 hypothetical protein [Prevotellaceae bacterium]